MAQGKAQSMMDQTPTSEAEPSNVPGMDVLSLGECASFTKTIAECDVYLLAGITGDFHSNHLDEERMRKTPFGRRIAHGTLAVGLMSTATSRLSSRIPEDWPCVSTKVEVRWRAPILIGDTITATAEVTRKTPERRELIMRTTCVNQEDKLVSEAQWTIKFV